MPIRLHAAEPAAEGCRVEPLGALVELLERKATHVADRSAVVAVDGRGGSGKTTLTGRLRRSMAGSEVVHTDDIAWAHSRFGWADLMIGGVLEPLRRGRSVRYRPPAWDARSREGRVDVDGSAPFVIIEGVGASQRELTGFLDASVWVQSDWVDAEERGLARDGHGPDVMAEWCAWQREEQPFLALDRPWERADVVVVVSPERPCDWETEVVLADVPEALRP